MDILRFGKVGICGKQFRQRREALTKGGRILGCFKRRSSENFQTTFCCFTVFLSDKTAFFNPPWRIRIDMHKKWEIFVCYKPLSR